MTRLVALRAVLAFGAIGAPVLATPPTLAVYVTDADEDVYVALYGDLAVELVACAGAQEARALLQLASETPALETTLAKLESDFAFGTHPRIPCGPAAAFDIDWPATTPIWADLAGSGNYFLPAPGGGEVFYAVPARCTGLKSALAIRERLQLPGVLRGLSAPEVLGRLVVLDCGGSGGEIEGPGETSTSVEELSLHRFDTFLTAESTGDTLWVVRYRPSTGAAVPAYLPIWRVNGRSVAELVLAGGEPASRTEAELKTLFGLPAAAGVTALGAEAVAAVRSAVHVDLCLADCEGYVHRHAAFLNPAVDLGVTEIGAGTASRRLSRLGEEQIVWRFVGSREAVLTSCNRAVAALGLQVSDAPDWLSSVEAVTLSAPGEGEGFACRESASETCLRRIADGEPLTQASFGPGADCAGARRLRIELPSTVRASAPLQLTGSDFESIEVVPRSGVDRSIVTGTPGRPGSAASSCVLSTTGALVFADRLRRLELRDVGLRRADGDAADEVVAIQVQSGALVLDDVEIGSDAEGTQPLTRGVSLCLADLYAVSSEIRAQSLGIQGVSARILLSGTSSEPTVIAEPRYGMLLSAASSLRMDHARIVARTPLVLRGGQAVAGRTELSPGSNAAGDSTAVMLERGASATFTTSTARGFRCVASFTDTESRAGFVLPGNDLARDNTHLACGAAGQFSLLE